MINIIIWKDWHGEYKVPAPDGREASAYYTCSLDDAVDSFDVMWKGLIDIAQCKIKLCDEHPEFLSDYDEKWEG